MYHGNIAVLKLLFYFLLGIAEDIANSLAYAGKIIWIFHTKFIRKCKFFVRKI
jgi:hypothetical protein